MSPSEFKTARRELGLTLAELGAILSTDPRAIRNWEAGGGTNARNPNPVASQATRWMLDGFRPPEWPAE